MSLVFDGSINIHVRYNSHSYLFSIYRNQYLPQFFPILQEYFHSTASVPLDTPIWLEYNNTPLKWNLPVGVLYDVLFSSMHSLSLSLWELELKVHSEHLSFPGSQIIPFPQSLALMTQYLESLRLVVVNHLKQSCYVINGSSRAMMALSESDSAALWRSILSHDYATFALINEKLIPAKWTHSIPVKILLAGTFTVLQCPVPVAQAPQPTLRLHLQQAVPELPLSLNDHSICIQGIDASVLLDEPLLDVWNHFRHLDNFLYVVVTMHH